MEEIDEDCDEELQNTINSLIAAEHLNAVSSISDELLS